MHEAAAAFDGAKPRSRARPSMATTDQDQPFTSGEITNRSPFLEKSVTTPSYPYDGPNDLIGLRFPWLRKL